MKRLLSTPVATALLFVLAAGLIGFGGIRGVQAAPRIESNVFGAQVELSNIDTALVENGTIREGDETLLTQLVPEGEEFEVGRTYPEALSVQNVGTIPQFVRVTVYRYWEDAVGNQIKATDLDPDFIELGFVTGEGWTIDAEASTEERTVLYYASVLEPGAFSSPFTDTLRISPDTLTVISGEDDWKYEGVTFHIKAVVDAVQTHNGEDAMTGVWGRTNEG